MFTSKKELLEAGIIDENGQFLRAVTFQELTGKESGVWFDYNPGSGDFVKSDWFADTEAVTFYGIYDKDGRARDIYPRLKKLTCQKVEAREVIDDDELESIKAWEPPMEDVESLTSGKCYGRYFTLDLDVDGENYSYYFFAPEDWN